MKELKDYGFIDKKVMQLIFSFLAIFMALDFITTSIALRSGFFETNAIIVKFIIYFGLTVGLALYFIIAISIFYFIYSLKEEYNLFKYPVLFYYTATFLSAVINNINLLITGGL